MPQTKPIRYKFNRVQNRSIGLVIFACWALSIIIAAGIESIFFRYGIPVLLLAFAIVYSWLQGKRVSQNEEILPQLELPSVTAYISKEKLPVLLMDISTMQVYWMNEVFEFEFKTTIENFIHTQLHTSILKIIRDKLDTSTSVLVKQLAEIIYPEKGKYRKAYKIIIQQLLHKNKSILYVGFIDITEYKQNIQLLNQEINELKSSVKEKTTAIFELDNQFQSLLGMSNEIIVRLSDELLIEFISDNYYLKTEYPENYFINKNFLEIFHGDDQVLVKTKFNQAKTEQSFKQTFEARINTKNGHSINCRCVVLFDKNKSNSGEYWIFINDISEIVLFSENMQINNLIYQNIASNIPNTAIILLDENNQCIMVKGDTVKLIGLTHFQIKANNVLDLPILNSIHQEFLSRNSEDNIQEIECRLSDSYVNIRKVIIKDSATQFHSTLLMITDISSYHSALVELESLNKNLEIKVEERTHKLEEMNAELEAFSYSISHDLKSPVRAISGYSKMLEEDFNSILPDEAKELNTKINSNALKMGLMIESLLKLSQFGKKEINKEIIQLNTIIEQLLKDFEIESHVEIIVQDLQPAYIDLNLFTHVYQNLISNALKFSSKNEHPKIEIGSITYEDEIHYFVKDNGVGFDMRYAPRLFSVFQRLHKESDFEGTGVGLAIVNRIINRHEGKIWCESEMGKGTTFYFQIPNIKTPLNNNNHD